MAYGRGGGGGRGKDYDNELQGTLFDNRDKQRRGKKDPDMTGVATVDGVEYWVNAWWNNSDKVGDYIKFKLTPKDDGPRVSNGRGRDRDDDPPAERSRGSYRRDDPPRGRGDDERGRDDRPSRRAPDRGTGFDEMDDDIPF